MREEEAWLVAFYKKETQLREAEEERLYWVQKDKETKATLQMKEQGEKCTGRVHVFNRAIHLHTSILLSLSISSFSCSLFLSLSLSLPLSVSLSLCVSVSLFSLSLSFSLFRKRTDQSKGREHEREIEQGPRYVGGVGGERREQSERGSEQMVEHTDGETVRLVVGWCWWLVLVVVCFGWLVWFL